MESPSPDVKDVAEFIKNILRENGVTKYEPALVDCLLQLACRNVTDLLESAAKLAQLSNPESSQITVEDLRLARQLQCETSKQRGGLEELLDKLAEEKNSVPLPTLRSNKGVALPPERHCLLMQNYRLRVGPTAQYSSQHMNRPASLDGPRKLLQNAPSGMVRYHSSSVSASLAAGSSQSDSMLRAEQQGITRGSFLPASNRSVFDHAVYVSSPRLPTMSGSIGQTMGPNKPRIASPIPDVKGELSSRSRFRLVLDSGGQSSSSDSSKQEFS
ncbi:hypothetical protein M514_05598 [Trichuris suis]|uniref:Uncharacterized protein n=1 Tax=Trichuris suis TaxID=68888 RepID=A0A085NQU1_9BILA|nr:hypothetical protein M513_05598 [Trichuris suis]KFD71837.1 hypothetical protein M514_05598 [Trichuris suis]KHJ41342.1 transcription initiation factor IID, subunit [Trichuris suis]